MMQHSELEERVISRLDGWFEGQAVGLLAYYGRYVGELRRPAIHALRAAVPPEKPFPNYLKTPTLLHLFERLRTRRLPEDEASFVRELKDRAQEQLACLDKPQGFIPGNWTCAERVSHFILQSTMSARGLLRELGNVLQESLEDEMQLTETLQEDLDTLRAPMNRYRPISDKFAGLNGTYARLHAIVELRDKLRPAFLLRGQDTPGIAWEQIESLLVHHVLYWPLVVPALRSANGKPIGSPAISVPIGIDTSFDGKGDVRILPPDRETDIEEWMTETERGNGLYNRFGYIVHAAKTLWRHQHKAYGQFCDSVHSASVAFDLTFLEQIGARVREMVPACPRMELGGGSMEVYLCAGVLNQFLGRQSVTTSVATAELGAQMQRASKSEPPQEVAKVKGRSGGYVYTTPKKKAGPDFEANFEINWPTGEVPKLDHAYMKRQFSRVVFPLRTKLEKNRCAELDLFIQENRGRQFLDVVHAATMNSAANCMCPTWRRHQYVRCPDVEWHVIKDELPGADREQVREMVQAIGENEGPFLTAIASNYSGYMAASTTASEFLLPVKLDH